jgi:hypothetical protein
MILDFNILLLYCYLKKIKNGNLIIRVYELPLIIKVIQLLAHSPCFATEPQLYQWKTNLRFFKDPSKKDSFSDINGISTNAHTLLKVLQE